MALGQLDLPADVLTYVDYPTSFDSTQAQKALKGSGIEVPPLESYAAKVWDYWERNLDPGLFKDRSLSGAVRGKIVLITGASSGIGKATAVKVADAGATVLLVARSVEKLEETRDEIVAAGGSAHIHRCDMSDIEDIERMAEEVLAYHGHVDILVNNAGRSIRRSVALSYDRFHDYERTIQLNYLGALRLILALLPTMRARKSGHIINISSIGTQTNPPRFSAYVASKAALDAFSRVIASEMVEDKIDITTINMPLVRTPMIAPTRMYDMFPAITPEEAAEMIAKAMVDAAEEGGDQTRQLRRAALRGGAEGQRQNPQHRLQALPRLAGGEGQRRRGARQSALDRGGRLRAPDERRALVARLSACSVAVRYADTQRLVQSAGRVTRETLNETRDRRWDAVARRGVEECPRCVPPSVCTATAQLRPASPAAQRFPKARRITAPTGPRFELEGTDWRHVDGDLLDRTSADVPDGRSRSFLEAEQSSKKVGTDNGLLAAEPLRVKHDFDVFNCGDGFGYSTARLQSDIRATLRSPARLG